MAECLTHTLAWHPKIHRPWNLTSNQYLRLSAKRPALLEHGDSDKGSLLHLHFFLASAQAQGPLLPPRSLCCYQSYLHTRAIFY